MKKQYFFPQLTGTCRQIKLAEQIREKIINELIKMSNARILNIRKKDRPGRVEILSLLANTLFDSAISHLLVNTDSKFWLKDGWLKINWGLVQNRVVCNNSELRQQLIKAHFNKSIHFLADWPELANKSGGSGEFDLDIYEIIQLYKFHVFSFYCYHSVKNDKVAFEAA